MKIAIELGPVGEAAYKTYMQERMRGHWIEECELTGVDFHLGYFPPLREDSLRISGGNSEGIEIEDFVT